MSKNQDHIADESRYDAEKVTNTRPVVNAKLLRWWKSLSQYQKSLYCEIYPHSDLTKGHIGSIIWDGWDAAKMRQYHKEQAEDLKVNVMSATSAVEKAKLNRLYQLQVHLSEKK